MSDKRVPINSGMARPKVADERKASNVYGSREYIE